MQAAIIVGCIALCAAWASAQTVTTTNVLGQSVVEVITVDPNLGVPTTSTVQTVVGVATTSATTTSATTTSATTTTTPVDQGPVGQPAATGPQSPTVYTYTTTDANGVTTAVIDTFTPTFYQSAHSPALSTGTILDYSSWLSMVGTNTDNAQAAQSTGGQLPLLHNGWYGVLGATVACVFGGAWQVLV